MISRFIIAFLFSRLLFAYQSMASTYPRRSGQSLGIATVAAEVFMLSRGALAGVKHDMDTGPKIAQVAALVGDPARANMLAALMDGRALTASELAYLSGV